MHIIVSMAFFLFVFVACLPRMTAVGQANVIVANDEMQEDINGRWWVNALIPCFDTEIGYVCTFGLVTRAATKTSGMFPRAFCAVTIASTTCNPKRATDVSDLLRPFSTHESLLHSCLEHEW